MADNQHKRSEFLCSAVGPPYKKGRYLNQKERKGTNWIYVMPVYLPLPQVHERRKDKYLQKCTSPPPSPQHTPPPHRTPASLSSHIHTTPLPLLFPFLIVPMTRESLWNMFLTLTKGPEARAEALREGTSA